MKYNLAIKKNEILPFAATWMGLENTILSEVSQTEKDKYCMISLICGIQKIIQMNLHTKRNRLTETESKLMVTKEKREGRRDKLGVWD